MNLLEMRNKTLNYLDDDSLDRYNSTDEIDGYINTAYITKYGEAVHARYPGLLSPRAFINIVNGQDYVNLPSDFYKARGVYLNYNNRYIPLTYKEQFEDVIDLTPKPFTMHKPDYFFRGSTLSFNAVPSGAIANGIMLEYYPECTRLVNDTDSPVTGFKKDWHEIIPVLAAIIAKEGREEDDATGLMRVLDRVSVPFSSDIFYMTESRMYTEPFDYGDLES